MRYALIICNIQTNKNFNKLHLIIHQISNFINVSKKCTAELFRY